MAVAGHRTPSMFGRDHIVAPAALQDKAQKLTAHFQAPSTKLTLTPSL
jgi:hypothetical protein